MSYRAKFTSHADFGTRVDVAEVDEQMFPRGEWVEIDEAMKQRLDGLKDHRFTIQPLEDDQPAISPAEAGEVVIERGREAVNTGAAGVPGQTGVNATGGAATADTTGPTADTGTTAGAGTGGRRTARTTT